MKESEARSAIGQLLLANWPGDGIARVRSDLSAYRFGGVVLHGRDTAVPEELRSRHREVWQLTERLSLEAPWVAVTEEGGTVHRFPKSVRPPSAKALAMWKQGEHVGPASRMMARFLASQGINWNFAPDLDVLTTESNPVIGTRAFANDAGTVALLGTAFIRAHQAEGVMATGKHFPGHGMTELDSHVAHPVADLPTNVLALHLEPFRAAVRDGVGAIMTAHVSYPQVDERIATFSPLWLRDILRGDLRFHGVVVSDALSMRGASGDRRLLDAALDALRAGVDVLDVGGTWADACALLDDLVEACQAGELDDQSILDSLERVRHAKRSLTLPDHWPEVPSSADLRAVYDPVHEGAVTAVGGMPASPPPSRTLWVAPPPSSEVVEVLPEPASWPSGSGLPSTLVRPDRWRENWQAVEMLPTDCTYLVVTANLWKDPELADRVRSWAKQRRCVHVALRDPLDLDIVDVHGLRIATYGEERPALLRALEWVMMLGTGASTADRMSDAAP